MADMSGVEAVAAKHVAEAIQYRSLDRSYWS
jgi:magnesium chelatase family protein